eukprot:COSAG05_NODE_5519_length_1153_cov_2.766603_1_plen_85_part_00
MTFQFQFQGWLRILTPLTSTLLTVLSVLNNTFRPSSSNLIPTAYHMAAQPGDRTTPAHTLFDEDGNEIPIEATVLARADAVAPQ